MKRVINLTSLEKDRCLGWYIDTLEFDDIPVKDVIYWNTECNTK